MTNYHQKYIEVIDELPLYVSQFFAAKNDKYQVQTRLVYAQDIRLFFRWLIDCVPDKVKATKLKDITLDELRLIDADDIDQFMLYLENYEVYDDRKKSMVTVSNSATGKARKLASLRSFFKFLLKRGKIDKNPTELTETPKIRKNKSIFTLSEDQQQIMLTKAIEATKPSSKIKDEKKTKTLREKTKYRDFAILSLLLGTGVRVSELCGINLYDIDVSEQSINILRKGGSADKVYFNSEVRDAIYDYLDNERNELMHIDVNDDKQTMADGPLFAARGAKRITPRRVQQIVKEYSSFAVPENQKVTPHTLRKTFGTDIYRKYRDLSLAQHALGHEHSSTTSRYYVNFDKDRLKILREDSADNR